MNRPLWLDFVYLGLFFTPPVLMAVLIVTAIGLTGWLSFVTYVGVAITAIIGWTALFVMWSRLMSRQ